MYVKFGKPTINKYLLLEMFEFNGKLMKENENILENTLDNIFEQIKEVKTINVYEYEPNILQKIKNKKNPENICFKINNYNTIKNILYYGEEISNECEKNLSLELKLINHIHNSKKIIVGKVILKPNEKPKFNLIYIKNTSLKY